MSRDGEPPDWALPAWDATDTEPAREARPRGRPHPPEPAERIRAGAPPIVPRGTFGLTILAVSDVTRAVREAVRSDDRLRDVWVEGEVGRVTVSSAGHAYFTLKDERSQLQCVWFRDDRLASPYEPQTGLRVVANGRVDVFDANGVYQLYVSAVQPAGFGDLALRFEALKAQLGAEGLFDPVRKRPLPDRPAVIAVVTSETGAVWHDIRTVLARRWPLARVVLSQCQVQGAGAPVSIVRALAWVDRYAERCVREGRPDDAPTVTILARGGGSLEDLWSFNDETVVRAIVRHSLPVVCGVGHETDVTLADFAADRRAPTPSAAAEIVVPDRVELGAVLSAETRRLEGAVRRLVAGATREASAERRALDGLSPVAQLAASRERAGLLLDRATRAVRARLDLAGTTSERLAARLRPSVLVRLGTARGALDAAGAALAALGPEATLERGYAIVRRGSDGRIVRDPAEAPAGEGLAIRLARGELAATVDRAGEGS
jgi:exodeoxyribonuclease VII large subunit